MERGVTQQQPEAGGKAGTLKRYLPLATIVAAAGLIFAMGWHHYLSIESLAANKDTLVSYVADHYLLAILGFAVTYILVVALSLPVASFLTIFGGLLFGAAVCGTVVVFSATIGALIVFLAARSSLGETLKDRAGPWLAKLQDGFNDNAMSYLLFLRLVPVFPFWLVNIAPALLGVRASTFAIGTLLGIIPGTFAFAFVGAGLGSVIDAQAHAHQDCLTKHGTDSATCVFSLDSSALLTPELLIAFAALGVVALIPVVLKKFKARA